MFSCVFFFLFLFKPIVKITKKKKFNFFLDSSSPYIFSRKEEELRESDFPSVMLFKKEEDNEKKTEEKEKNTIDTDVSKSQGPTQIPEQIPEQVSETKTIDIEHTTMTISPPTKQMKEEKKEEKIEHLTHWQEHKKRKSLHKTSSGNHLTINFAPTSADMFVCSFVLMWFLLLPSLVGIGFTIFECRTVGKGMYSKSKFLRIQG